MQSAQLKKERDKIDKTKVFTRSQECSIQINVERDKTIRKMDNDGGKLKLLQFHALSDN